MTATVTPGIATTGAGTMLPLIALPQDQILTVNVNDIPWLKDATGPGIHIQPLRLAPQRGGVVVLAAVAPGPPTRPPRPAPEGGGLVALAAIARGAELPIHYHTGTAEVYTLSGRWEYREYPDQPQIAGPYRYEPAGTVHTFFTPE